MLDDESDDEDELDDADWFEIRAKVSLSPDATARMMRDVKIIKIDANMTAPNPVRVDVMAKGLIRSFQVSRNETSFDPRANSRRTFRGNT